MRSPIRKEGACLHGPQESEVYHPDKANQVADTLSRRRVDVASGKDEQDLIVILANLSLQVPTDETRPTCTKALEQANLLWRIREVQQVDPFLEKIFEKGVIGIISQQTGYSCLRIG